MRRESDLVLAGLPARFDEMKRRVDRFEIGLAHNTETTERVEKNTAHIVSFVDDVTVVWKACKFVRRMTFTAAKWTAAVAGAFTAVAAALHAAGTIDVKAWFR
jgi:hypothetical protein